MRASGPVHAIRGGGPQHLTTGEILGNHDVFIEPGVEDDGSIGQDPFAFAGGDERLVAAVVLGRLMQRPPNIDLRFDQFIVDEKL